jgi:hypothetical protein
VIAGAGLLGVVDAAPGPTTTALAVPVDGVLVVLAAYGGTTAVPATNATVVINGTPTGAPSALPPAGGVLLLPQGLSVAAGDYVEISVDAAWDGSVVAYIVPVET